MGKVIKVIKVTSEAHSKDAVVKLGTCACVCVFRCFGVLMCQCVGVCRCVSVCVLMCECVGAFGVWLPQGPVKVPPA